MKKQDFFIKPRAMTPQNTILLSTWGLAPEGLSQSMGRDWVRLHASRDQHFILNTLECYDTREWVGYTRQEDYLKINFWLGGRHTTVLDGYGQHHHEGPEVFLTGGPPDMVKIDLRGRDTRVASVALCVLPEFFPVHLGLAVDELPELLRNALAEPRNYSFHRFHLTAELHTAARAILSVPFAIRRMPSYRQAKAVELMCLLLARLDAEARRGSPTTQVPAYQETRLYEARELLDQHYAEPLTLERVAHLVGLNKLALTNGFRQLFGMSVHDCLQKIRMERAYELLQDPVHTVSRVAQAVGYRHSCNFSTAFLAYFGCTPLEARTRRFS